MDWQDERAFLYNEVRRLIKDVEIKEFVLAALDNAPDYIWHIFASTSGNNHGGETQTHHVLMALKIAEHLSDILNHWIVKKYAHLAENDMDILYAIVTLHDLYKCGKPGQERKIDGVFRTDMLHPKYVPDMTKNIMVTDKATKEQARAETRDWWPKFVSGVCGHAGPWSEWPMPEEALFDFGNLTMLGFLCDYFASRRGISIAI